MYVSYISSPPPQKVLVDKYIQYRDDASSKKTSFNKERFDCFMSVLLSFHCETGVDKEEYMSLTMSLFEEEN